VVAERDVSAARAGKPKPEAPVGPRSTNGEVGEARREGAGKLGPAAEAGTPSVTADDNMLEESEDVILETGAPDSHEVARMHALWRARLVRTSPSSAAAAIRRHRPEEHLVPAWLRPTEGEHIWQIAVAVAFAIALQLLVPARLALKPTWVLPALEAALLVFLVIATPSRMTRHTPQTRLAVITLLSAVSFGNAWSLVLLIHGLVSGTEGQKGGPLLLTGAAIWGTNVIVFSFWYWAFDRGGPGARAQAARPHPDLLFPQMSVPELSPHDWEPTYFDYLYTSFTNATAFSPTDTMPLARWTKLLFLIQSAISLLAGALVIARAVNILK
jgi:uncharacterized membrane protein